jgi:cholesterol transport system auxiliary component
MFERQNKVSGPDKARVLAPLAALLLALALEACGGSAPQTFDLSAVAISSERPLRAQLAVREPTASLDLDSQRILVRTGPEALAYLSGAQWADRLPALVQSRLVQTFQNAKLLRVSRGGAGLAADYNLELDIRAFELDVPNGQGVVDNAAKIVAAKGGRVVAAHVFRDAVPSGGTGGPAAATALDQALSSVMTQIVAYTTARI